MKYTIYIYNIYIYTCIINVVFKEKEYYDSKKISCADISYRTLIFANCESSRRMMYICVNVIRISGFWPFWRISGIGPFSQISGANRFRQSLVLCECSNIALNSFLIYNCYACCQVDFCSGNELHIVLEMWWKNLSLVTVID